MSHVANSALMDTISDMYDELECLRGELAYLDSENMLLAAADVYDQILKLTKKIEELSEYLHNLSL